MRIVRTGSRSPSIVATYLFAIVTGIIFFASADAADRPSVSWDLGSIQSEAESYVRVAEQKLTAGDEAAAAEAFLFAAEYYLQLDDHQRSDANVRRSLDAAERAHLDRMIVRALGISADLRLRNGSPAEADPFVARALALAAGLNDPCATGAAESAAGNTEYSKLHFQASVDHLLLAVEAWQTCAETKNEIETMLSLGYAYVGLDQTLTAKNYVETALSKALIAGDRRLEAIARMEMGLIHLQLNEPQRALETCRRSEAIFPDDMEFLERARLVGGIGSIYRMYGDWNSSLIESRRALALYRRAGSAIGELSIASELINLELLNGDEIAARSYFEIVRRLSSGLNDNFYLSSAFQYFGSYFLRNGDLKRADEYFNKALRSLERSGIDQGKGFIMTRLGEICERRGESALADKYYQRSLAASRSAGDRFGEADAYYSLAKFQLAAGRPASADISIRRSIAITESLSTNVNDPHLRREYFANYYDRYELYVRTLEANGKAGDTAAFEASERSRARVMLEGLLLNEVDSVRGADGDVLLREKELLATLNSKADKLAVAGESRASSDEKEALIAEISGLQNRLGELRASIKASNPLYAAIKDPPPFDVAAFQRDVLDDDSVFLEFSLGTDASYLWVVDRVGVSSYLLPPRAMIEKQIDRLLELVKSREQQPNETVEAYSERVTAADTEYPRAAAELSRTLLAGAAEKIRGKRLIVSPDGRLGYFPLGALPSPVADEPLIAVNDVVYTPSAMIYSIQRSMRQTGTTDATKDLLVFADPVFSPSDPRLSAGHIDAGVIERAFATLRSNDSIKDLPRLSASEAEADAVSGVVSGATVVSGFAANRERVLDPDLSNYRIIHFATHGLLDTEHPELSGILLSLFDRDGNANEGFIRSHDIYGIKLNADLVVLSACDTGVGRNIRGEGIMSLNNAFMQAGSRTVVSSLWKVDDAATEMLMQKFYRHLTDGDRSVADALRAAQNELRQDPLYRSPFYWAAFMANGDGKVGIKVSTGRSYLAAAAVAVCGLSIVVIWMLRRRYSTEKS